MLRELERLYGNWKGFIKGKLSCLIVPMLIVGTVFARFRSFTPGTSNQISNWQYWYLNPVALLRPAVCWLVGKWHAAKCRNYPNRLQ